MLLLQDNEHVHVVRSVFACIVTPHATYAASADTLQTIW